MLVRRRPAQLQGPGGVARRPAGARDHAQRRVDRGGSPAPGPGSRRGAEGRRCHVLMRVPGSRPACDFAAAGKLVELWHLLLGHSWQPVSAAQVAADGCGSVPLSCTGRAMVATAGVLVFCAGDGRPGLLRLVARRLSSSSRQMERHRRTQAPLVRSPPAAAQPQLAAAAASNKAVAMHCKTLFQGFGSFALQTLGVSANAMRQWHALNCMKVRVFQQRSGQLGRKPMSCSSGECKECRTQHSW